MFDIINEDYEFIEKTPAGLIFVIKNKKYYLVDNNGNISRYYDKIHIIGNKIAYVKTISPFHRQEGWLDSERCEYDKIDYIRESISGNFIVCKKVTNGKTLYGYVDKDWNIKICFLFRMANTFHSGYAIIYIDRNIGLISQNTTPSGYPHFTIKPFYGDIERYESSNRYAKITDYTLKGEGVIDIKEECYIIPCSPNKTIHKLTHHSIFFIKDNHSNIVSIIDHCGKELMPCKYPHIIEIGHYLCQYNNKDEYEFYTHTGEIVTTPSHKYINLLHKEIDYNHHRRYDIDDNINLNNGCGEYWSCLNCPHIGCPSNEMN